MATLKVIRCKECTMPLPPGATICPRCKTAHVVEAEVNPLHLSAEMSKDYIQYFQQQTATNPKDTNALFGMGLVYLGLRNYELAQRNFQLAVDQSPLEPDIYYYFALSLFEGHNPMHLNNTVTTRIEEWLHTAVNRQAKRKYLILQMVLRQGAFIANGLQVKGEQPAELMVRIRQMMPEADELKEIQEHVQITDPQTKEWLQELTEGKAAKKSAPDRLILKDGRDFDEMLCSYLPMEVCEQVEDVTERDEYFYTDDTDTNTVHRVATLLDEEKRDTFFRYQYEPVEPEKESKPFPPLWKAIKLTIGYFILWFAMLFFLAFEPFGLGMPEIETTAKTPKAEIEAYFNNHWCIGYETLTMDKEDNEVEKTVLGRIDTPLEKPFADGVEEVTYYGFARSWQGITTIVLFFLPVLLYLIRLLMVFGSNIKERKEVGRHNREAQEAYLFEKQMVEERATKLEYIAFCEQYLSQHSELLEKTGDPVSLALRQNNIDELDMRGKILFVNYFDDTDADGNDSNSPHDVLSRIYYIIAIPERDKLVMMKNAWYTLYNRFEACDVEFLYYSSIAGVNIVNNTIEIEKKGGGTPSGIVLPACGCSIFSYQDKDPSDRHTYSNTRTSDPQAFVRALNTLIEAKA